VGLEAGALWGEQCERGAALVRQSVLSEREFRHVVEEREEWGRGGYVKVHASGREGHEYLHKKDVLHGVLKVSLFMRVVLEVTEYILNVGRERACG
jgi:hypothetical protein